MPVVSEDRPSASWYERVPLGLPAGRSVLASEQLELAPEPRNASLARRWVVGRLPEWSDEEMRDALALLTSELVTNGVVHARTPLLLGIAVTERDVLVGVHDLDLGLQEEPGPERHGGRGIAMVADLATDWGYVRHPGGGKTVWFRMSR